MKLQTLIDRLGITAKVKQVDHNPNMADEDWARTANHWRVTLTRRNPRRRMTVPFSTGSAITDEPTAADVLDCLASEANGYENTTAFPEWAAEYGYDEDSRKAERTYRAVARSAKRLSHFMGAEYGELIYDTERL